MINKNFRHTDPVREYNENIFRQAKKDLEQQLGETLYGIMMDFDEPLENRINTCYSFMQDFSRDAAGDLNVAYSLDVRTRLADRNTLNMEFCHTIDITPTEALLEGNTDNFPVMKRGPDIPYIRV